MMGQVQGMNVSEEEIQSAVDQANELLRLYRLPKRTPQQLRDVYNRVLTLLTRLKKGKAMMNQFEEIYRSNPTSKNNQETMNQIFDLYCLLQRLLGLYMDFYKQVMSPEDYQTIMMRVIQKWQEEGVGQDGKERTEAV